MSREEKIIARLRDVRRESHGEDLVGFARGLGVPAFHWMGYELGDPVPAAVLRALLERTGVSMRWLVTGRLPRHDGTQDAGVDGAVRSSAACT